VSPAAVAACRVAAYADLESEFIAAGLPIVTSDTPARATLVRELGPGAEYMAGDPYSLESLVAR